MTIIFTTEQIAALPVGTELTCTFAAGSVRYIRSSRGWTTAFEGHSGSVGTAFVKPGGCIAADAFSTALETGTVGITDSFSTLAGPCA